jgi:hypothetical protein
MNMFKITTEVRAILLASDSIKDIVDEKIFPVIAPENLSFISVMVTNRIAPSLAYTGRYRL